MDNEFLDQVEEDLNDNSNEPATRGDVRNLALRVDLRFTKLESSIDQRFMAIDNRFTTFDESLKEYINKLGWRIFAATIGSAALMFVICGIYINSILK